MLSRSANLLPLNPERLNRNFWKHVEKRGPRQCWPWRGCKNSKGYGVISYLCADGVSRRFLAHRVAKILATKQLPLPLIQTMHCCDNRPCCNDRHLFEGSQSDNMRDALRKGRAYIGSLNGSWKPELHLVQGSLAT